MFIIIISTILALLVPIVVVLATIILSIRSINDREKLSPFECGFDPNHKARIPFSTRFFLLAIIFIVFDIEIVLLIPLPIIFITLDAIKIICRLRFLIILLLGILHEWNQGALNWSI